MVIKVQRSVSLAVALPLLANSRAAQAQTVEAVAGGVQGFLLAGAAASVTLAICVIGWFYMTGRGSTQPIWHVVFGALMLGSVGSIIAAASGGGVGGMASLFVGWLTVAMYIAAAVFVAFAGWKHLFSRGSFELLVPIAGGILLVILAQSITGMLGI